jgi:hypothetical protein
MNVMPSKRYGEASDRKSIGRVERLPRLYTSARPASSPASDRRRAVAGRPELTLIYKTGMKGDVDVKAESPSMREIVRTAFDTAVDD